MSEELFSYGYYEGTTGDLLLVSMRRCARCYCGRGLATCVIITVTVFNCGRGLACCFQITLEEVLLVTNSNTITVAEGFPHVLLLLSLCPCSRGLAPHPEPRHSTSHLCHTSPAPLATSSITLHHSTSSTTCYITTNHVIGSLSSSLPGSVSLVSNHRTHIHRIAQKHTALICI